MYFFIRSSSGFPFVISLEKIINISLLVSHFHLPEGCTFCFFKCVSCEHDDSIWASISVGVMSLVFTVPALTSAGDSGANFPDAFCRAGSNFSCSH